MHISISPDGLTLYFTSNRNGYGQLFKATRESLDAPFGNLEHLSFFDSPGSILGFPSITSDGTAFYFTKSINGEPADIYVSYLIEEPLELATMRIEDAIAEKLDTLERINAALGKEWTAYEALEELLESGDYGDLNKNDVLTATREVRSAIQNQERSKKTLEKSIEKLENALAALGFEP